MMTKIKKARGANTFLLEGEKDKKFLFQQYLTAFGGILTVPLLLAPYFCMADDHLSVSQLISTIFFVSGICTLLQTTIGCRYSSRALQLEIQRVRVNPEL